jgi:hypothetical protein
MESITIHSKTKQQANLFEQLAKTLKVPFEKSKKNKSPYNPELVEKIERSRKNYKEGKGTVVTIQGLREL